jgi:hypothetical protein
MAVFGNQQKGGGGCGGGGSGEGLHHKGAATIKYKATDPKS